MHTPSEWTAAGPAFFFQHSYQGLKLKPTLTAKRLSEPAVPPWAYESNMLVSQFNWSATVRMYVMENFFSLFLRRTT
jgi:hypothetical protein